MSPGVASVTGAAAVCASSSAERDADRAMGRARIASRRRPNSATTVASPIKTKPPVKALTPATMSVVPSVNSLMGMPNPIAATPAAVTAMPNSDKIVAMFAPRPGPAMLGSSHGAMVIKEFWPRCTPIAITNVTARPSNPSLINTRRSIHADGRLYADCAQRSLAWSLARANTVIDGPATVACPGTRRSVAPPAGPA
jgi:hypothetical protein